MDIENPILKECLMNKLIEPDKDINLQEISTEGIDIRKWKLDTQKSKNFRINFWDFGGQGKYRAVQQFFCSRNSLYVFVTEPEDDIQKSDRFPFISAKITGS